MDVLFDAKTAERLIKQMDAYCSSIEKETRALLNIVNSSEEWKDHQKDAFQININELAKDLNFALKLESDYMKAFYQRVMELRGQ